ncbi:MAG: MmcB family DNA repair protein, partial [Roseibium sp.]
MTPSGQRVTLDDPLTDGRQSETALKIWRGTARMLRALNFAC